MGRVKGGKAERRSGGEGERGKELEERECQSQGMRYRGEVLAIRRQQRAERTRRQPSCRQCRDCQRLAPLPTPGVDGPAAFDKAAANCPLTGSGRRPRAALRPPAVRSLERRVAGKATVGAAAIAQAIT